MSTRSKGGSKWRMISQMCQFRMRIRRKHKDMRLKEGGSLEREWVDEEAGDMEEDDLVEKQAARMDMFRFMAVAANEEFRFIAFAAPIHLFRQCPVQ